MREKFVLDLVVFGEILLIKNKAANFKYADTWAFVAQFFVKLSSSRLINFFIKLVDCFDNY